MNIKLEDEVKLLNGVTGKITKILLDTVELYSNNEGLNKKDFTTYIVPQSLITTVNGISINTELVNREIETNQPNAGGE